MSIVTAAYNSAATIGDTVRSVVAQTYEPVEHIIVDGGSTDGTVEVVKELERLYAPGKRLVVGSGPDRGIYDAMNKGIARATGDVIGILNSDDFFSSPNSLGRLMDALTKDVDAVYADLHYVSDSDLTVPLRIYHSGAFSRRRMLMGMQPAHPTFYCRRECYERFGGVRHRLQGGGRFRAASPHDLRRAHTHLLCAVRLRDDASGRGVDVGPGKPSTDYARPSAGVQEKSCAGQFFYRLSALFLETGRTGRGASALEP